MWKYQQITRQQFEERKEFVEKILIESGAVPTNLGQETIAPTRTVFHNKNEYYRVDEVLFDQKPFIVIEWADKVENVINNTMEDTDPLPFDLEDDKMIEYVKKLLRQ